MHQSSNSWISSYSSRDTTLLLGAWLVVMWAALTSWAQHAQFGLVSAVHPIVNKLLLMAHALIFILVIFIPPLALVVHKRGKSQFFARFTKQFQTTPSIFVLADCLSLLLLFNAYAPPTRLRTFVSFIEGLILGLMLLWLFYRCEQRDWQSLLLGGLWLLLFVFALMTLRWWWREQSIAAAYRNGYTLLIGVLALIPFALTPPHVRSLLTPSLRVLKVLPLKALTLLVFMMLATRITIGIMRVDNPTPFTHSLTLLEIILIGLLVLRLHGNPTNSLLPVSKIHYRVSLMLWIIVYLVVGLLLVPAWVGAVSLDGYTYLNTARNYATGNFVVRGLWSPLMSWLMAPFVALGGHPQVVQRVGVVINGLIWMLLSNKLAERFKLKPVTRLCLTVAVGAFALRYGFWPLTPDPLAAMILTAYFIVISSERALNHPIRLGLAAGVLGALAYFAKYFNIGFIPMHLLLSGILFYLSGNMFSQTAKFLGAAIGIFMIMIAPWVVLVSLRYGMPTASIAGTFIRSVMLPPHNTIDLTCVTNPLCTQPNDVLFPWEDPDPTVYMPYAWSPLDSSEDFQRAIWITKDNLWYFMQEQALEAGGAIPLALLILTLSTYRVWKDPDQRTRNLWLSLTVVLYILGHATTNAGEFRYFYTLIPFGFIAAYWWIQWALERLAAAPLSAHIAILLRAALLAAPIVLTTTRPSQYIPSISLRSPAQRCQEFDAQTMRPFLSAPMVGDSGGIHLLSYYTQVRTYGVARGNAAEVNSALRDAGVRTYVVHANSELATLLIEDYRYKVVAEKSYCDEDFIILSIYP